MALRPGNYIPKGSEDPSEVVHVRMREGELVHSPRMGGMIMPVAQDRGFARRHEPVSDERLAAMLGRLGRGYVKDDWQEPGDAPIPCVLGGDTWNGFAVPEFEKDVVDERIVPSVANPDNPCRLGYDAASDAYLYVEIRDAVEPWDFDYAAIGKAVTGDSGSLDIVHPSGTAVAADVTAYRGRDVEVEGEKLRVYGIGAYSWTWSKADEPSAAPSP